MCDHKIIGQFSEQFDTVICYNNHFLQLNPADGWINTIESFNGHSHTGLIGLRMLQRPEPIGYGVLIKPQSDPVPHVIAPNGILR